MSDSRPPRPLERLLEWALPDGLSGQGTLGDLAEEFERRASRSSLRARLWYAVQALSLVAYRMIPGGRREGSGRGSDLLMDLRWSWRAVGKHPGFALGVVAVLGLGLGANVAVFSVVDGTLKNTSWWSAPERTVAVWPDRQFSYGQIELYRERQAPYRSLGGYVEVAFAIQNRDDESESVNGVVVTPELFRELAVQPALGRTMADDDAFFAGERVVVIGETLWRRSFGADPAVVGSRITISGAPATVIGIQGAGGMAPGGRAEVWFPLTMDPRDDDFWKAQSHRMVGVLNEDAGLADAAVDLEAYTDHLSELFPMFYPDGWADGLATVTRADAAQRRLISTPLMLLFAGTGLLMMVTALNVGNLLLGRGIDRRRELAVRISIGAGRGRIVRQLLVEGLVLTLLALVLGLLSGALGARWIARLFIEQPVVGHTSVLAPHLLMFTCTLAAVAWLVVNGVPVVHFLRTQRGGPTVKPDSGARMQRTLVAAQAALATLLLVSATLLVATVDNLRRVPLGFEADGILAAEMSPPEERTNDNAAARDLYDRLVADAERLPGVQSAGLTGWLPLRAQAPATPINLEAAPVDPREATKAPMHMVDAGFFEVFGIRPLEGRLLSYEDRFGQKNNPGASKEIGPTAIVVNETLADMLWPDGDAIGQRVAIDPHAWDTWAPVVGVIPDIRSGAITGPIGPALYVALAESPSRDVTVVVRSDASPGPMMAALGRTMRSVDALVPLRAVSDMNDVVRSAYATAWVMMGLLTVLAALATGLGAIGIYAMLAQHVALTKREIGVRMALGARPSVVIGRVVRSGLGLAGIGIVAGSIGAAMSTRLLESLLFGVSALAPWAFAAPALALALAAVLAACVPALRAGRLPPADVLRGD